MKLKVMAAHAALIMAAACGANGAQAAQVVVGQVGPMSGLEASQGRAYATGMQLYFNAVNKAGGINGNTFALVRRDDSGRPEDTLALTRTMLAEDKPLVLAGYFGSRNLAEVAPVLEKEKIALVGYRTAEIRPEAPYVYNVRATLRDEVDKLAQHLATIGITRIGLVYENGPGAPALLAAADEAAKKAHSTITLKVGYEAGTARVAPAVEQLLKNPPQAILLVTSGAAAAAFIEQYRSSGGAAQLFAHSGADIEQLSKRLSEEQMQGVAIAQVTPSPYKISGKLAKEFIDTASKTPNLEVPVSYAMMEGYIAAHVIVEAVRRQGAKPSREGVVAALDSIDNYDLGGYVVGFKGNQHSGSRFVELSIITGAGKIRQ
ncbi:ABC transporter substrate-binding protein [Ramlibacter sp. G-1-2-2]|uniref:ABC transporter substrate-binding protein n=1 Tax=Ramlibacter agri TaxID=2728837 RepID=A0A848HAA8_9BURK|nr:ABC transporter substrate-binding protein [Ramlibacter agri]